MTAFTVGADPEYFAHDGNEFISAIGRIPGFKHKPELIPCGAIHVDNVACEINTHPADCPESFSEAIAAPMSYVTDLLKAQNLLLSTEAYAVFESSQLDSAEACEGGCDPDYCAYTGGMNTPPNLMDTDARSAAGHVHVGIKITEEEVLKLVKTLDLYLTIPALQYENPERRTLYGKAGCFRRKPYGLEYRTPSNFWTFTDSRRQWVYTAVELAVNMFREIILPENLEEVINSNDVVAAQSIMYVYDIPECPN